MKNIKKETMENKSSNKGITLIALVITIIVLLILAGVSVVTLTGENGILTQVDKAKNENKKAEERDQIGLAYNAAKLDKLAKGDSSNITAAELKAELEKNGVSVKSATEDEEGTITIELSSGNKYAVTQSGTIQEVVGSGPQEPEELTTVAEAKTQEIVYEDNTKLVDDFGNSVTIPKGFKIARDSATDVTEGIVIEDATYEGTYGSQFVWIPVGDIYTDIERTEENKETITLGRYNFVKNDDGTVTVENFENNPYVYDEYLCTEDTATSHNPDCLNAIAKDIEGFIESTGIDENGGYYIGRYEAGVSEGEADEEEMERNG